MPFGDIEDKTRLAITFESFVYPTVGLFNKIMLVIAETIENY